MSVSPISRRQFLRGAAGAGLVTAAGLSVANASTIERLFRARDKHGPLPVGSGILVLVTLYGGNDGLSTVIPAGDGLYRAGRGTLAVAEADVLDLGEGLGFHPALKEMKGLWDAGHLAVVRGVGYPQPSRSHFRSMDIWQSGVPDSAVGTGWLGRWLDATGGDPLRAISVGPGVPLALVGERTAGTGVPVGPLTIPGGPGLHDAVAAFSAGVADDQSLATKAAHSYRDLLHAQTVISSALAGVPQGPDGAGSGSLDGGDGAAAGGPTTSIPIAGKGKVKGQGKGKAGGKAKPAAGAAGELGAQLDLVAALVKAAVPVSVYSVSLGGFDTHVDEQQTHDKLMAELDAGIGAFLKGLDGDPQGAGVTVLVHSEFGRRVAANASRGTDHGTAGPVFLAGSKVKGGFHGDEPSLADLDDGDLKATTDFRSVYGAVVGHVLGADAGTALPGRQPAPIPLFLT